MAFVTNFWEMWCEAAPWLIFGLLISGLLKAWFPTRWMQKWLGQPGLGSIARAAIIGTPVPLCSCSVLPAAMQLRRGGAAKGSTVSFLIATPENGADSLAVSYALLGPFMTIIRPVAAIFSAVVAGLTTEWFDRDSESETATTAAEPLKPCCQHKVSKAGEKDEEKTSLIGGLTYALTRLLSDITLWLIVGIGLAAVIQTLLPESALEQWGSGLVPMIGMLLLGIPMYICATASTPVGAAMLLAGVSPGTVLVFLLAGPATNMAGIAVVRKEIGRAAVIGYLTGICGMSIAFGLLTDWIVVNWSLDVAAQAGVARMLPHWLSLTCGVLLVLLMIRAKWMERPRQPNQPQGENDAVDSSQLVQIG